MGHVPAGTVRQERQGDDVPRRKYRRARAKLGPVSNRNLGSFGEAVASRFLADRGATIVDRNLRIGRGELDLVVSLDGELVAVEVKTGSVGPGNDPIHHFDDAKQYQVRALATQRGVYRVDYLGVAVSAAGVTIRWLPRVC
ncbi:MAG: hypothetical protein GY926_06700 [bacterium]|nr:hypothetical protein [bacterium]MCP4964909.1 hypothetical protein [bacterium]